MRVVTNKEQATKIIQHEKSKYSVCLKKRKILRKNPRQTKKKKNQRMSSIKHHQLY